MQSDGEACVYVKRSAAMRIDAIMARWWLPSASQQGALTRSRDARQDTGSRKRSLRQSRKHCGSCAHN